MAKTRGSLVRKAVVDHDAAALAKTIPASRASSSRGRMPAEKMTRSTSRTSPPANSSPRHLAAVGASSRRAPFWSRRTWTPRARCCSSRAEATGSSWRGIRRGATRRRGSRCRRRGRRAPPPARGGPPPITAARREVGHEARIAVEILDRAVDEDASLVDAGDFGNERGRPCREDQDVVPEDGAVVGSHLPALPIDARDARPDAQIDVALAVPAGRPESQRFGRKHQADRSSGVRGRRRAAAPRRDCA